MPDDATNEAAVAATPSPSQIGRALVVRWDAMTAAGDRAGAYEILTKELSDRIVECIRLYIGCNLQNEGRNAVKKAYDKIMDAVVGPHTKDGIAIRDPRPGMFMTVVHRRSQDALRQAEAEEKREAEDRQRAWLQPDAGALFEANMIRRLSLQDAVKKLPKRMRAFMRMLAEEQDHAQIASKFGVTTRTVRNWRRSLRIDALRDLL